MGDSPLNLVSSPSVTNPVLTHVDILDVPSSFVADPFMVRVDQTWYMFFEVMNLSSHKGEIGLAVSANGMKWTYQHVVLAEPFHLSYPYVFEWKNEYYMIPESHKSSSVRLYKALTFPLKWLFVATLLDDGCYNDPSVFRADGKWWLFSETDPDMKSNILRLYYSDDLVGPWHEHPKSPVIVGNPHIARPGGRVLASDDRLIRYTQDCYPRYGTQIRAFEITELTARSYKEKEALENPILSRGDDGAWNAAGMHHIDPHQISENKWIACVDGHRKVWLSDSDVNSSR